MATTYNLISNNTLGSTTATVTFSSIPATYTDLLLKWSARCNRVTFTNIMRVQVNSLTAKSSSTYIEGDGSVASSSNNSAIDYYWVGYAPGTDQTSNTFNNGELYIPNYQYGGDKPSGTFNVSENNATSTQVFIDKFSGMLQSAATVSSLTISLSLSSFVSGSSFYLYGIKNS
jgi:hypothetical protein